MHFTTRRFLAREERRGNFSLKFPVSRNSALFCLFLPLLCLRRFVFLFLLLFILISVVFFFLFSLQCYFSKATRIDQFCRLIMLSIILFHFLFFLLSERYHYFFRPSQLVYLDNTGYRLALDSEDEPSFIEARTDAIDSLTIEKLSPSRSNGTDGVSLTRAPTDGLVNAYDEGEVKSDAERDESIDYNMALVEFPEETERQAAHF